tara:strand:+ start:749 stop:1492 length:744 start_codon:yes stop_codon:yes gene_type:complete
MKDIKMNKDKIIGLIDGDVLIYRSIHKSEKDNIKPNDAFDSVMKQIKIDTACDEYKLHVSGKGNFRREIEQPYTVYKGQRKEKPPQFRELKEYVIETYKPTMHDGLEADDTISIEATKYIKINQLYMLITIDKDLKNIGGLFYNLMHNNLIAVSKKEAIEFFHAQLLTGDSVDNIPGIEGIGKVKAANILKDKTIKEQFESVIAAYKTHYKKDHRNRLEVMGKMLYLLKDIDDKWTINFWKGYIKNV